MEIERKILGIDKEKLLAHIAALTPAARRLFSGLVRVSYFDFFDKRIKKRCDLLRVREFLEKGRPPYAELVYKIYRGVKQGSKFLEEHEVRVEGPSAYKNLCAFLKCLGLKKTLYYEKRRTLFTFQDCAFEIDEHPQIPVFLEIEAPSPRRIDAMVRLLGLENCEQTPASISELIARKYKPLKLNGLVFGNE